MLIKLISTPVCVSKSLQPHGLFLPSSSVYEIFQARILEWVVISYQRIFPTQGLNPSFLCLLHWQVDFFTTVPPWKPDSFLGEQYFQRNGAMLLSLWEFTGKQMHQQKKNNCAETLKGKGLGIVTFILREFRPH